MSEEYFPDFESITSTENDFSDSPFLRSNKDVSVSLIHEEAQSKRLKVGSLNWIFYEIYDEQNPEKKMVFRQNSPESSAVFTYCAKQKHLTKIILARNGVPVPFGQVFADYESAYRYFKQCDAEVAVKPATGSHGRGVSTGISNDKDFHTAWNFASRPGESVIVEQSLKGYDLRVLVIGGCAAAAYMRVPANVVGDGRKTIDELVAEKNIRRSQNPSLRIDPISRFDLLEREGRSLSEVPAEGERVWLTSVANISAGGDIIQFIDKVNPNVLRLAERAALAFPGLEQVGVDLIVGTGSDAVDGESQNAAEQQPVAYVLEVNSNPSISDAVFPNFGRSINVPQRLLSHVFDSWEFPVTNGLAEQIIPAARCENSDSETYFSGGFTGQLEVIKQAAYTNNVQVEMLSKFVFVLSYAGNSTTFYKGLPDRTGITPRNICRNRKWMLDLLRKQSISTSLNRSELGSVRQYRIIVISGRVVAALCSENRYNTDLKNFYSGNRTRDITEDVHPGFVKIAVDAVAAVFNPFIAGVNIVVRDISRSPEKQGWKVDDVVCNPMLSWHHFPGEGRGRDVATALLYALFPDLQQAPKIRRSVQVTVSFGGNGEVDSKARDEIKETEFESWLKRQAMLHGVSGWVRSLPSGHVDVVLEGSPVAIDTLLELFRTGSPVSATAEFSLKSFAETGLKKFWVLN